MSTQRPPRGYQNMPTSGNDYQLPPLPRGTRKTARQGMDYRESFLRRTPQNRLSTPRREDKAECCDCELEDNVFDPAQRPRNSAGSARNYGPRTSTPHYPRARTYNSQEETIWSTSPESSFSSSSGGDWSTSSSGSSVCSTPDSPAWEGSPRSGRRLSSEGRKFRYAEGNYGRPPSLDVNIFEYNPSTDTPKLPPRGQVRKRTLPSWPNTPSPIKDTTRQSPYLEKFNVDSPPWDFETRHTMPEKPSRRISMPKVPSSASGKSYTGPTLSWAATPDGKPTVVINSLDPREATSPIHGLTADTYNSFVRKQDLALVMFYNSGHTSSGSVQEWAKRHFMKAAQLTAGSAQTFAAVDCAKEPDLCANQQINTFPFFKLYSKGYLIKHITDFANLIKGT